MLWPHFLPLQLVSSPGHALQGKARGPLEPPLEPRCHLSPPTVPEELVEVPVLHVLKDHDERVALHADAIELDDVLVLQVGQQLRLAVEVLARIVAGVLQRLRQGAERVA